MPKQFKTVEFEDRKKIASMYADGAIAAEIARKIGVSASTIYAELKRGQDGVTLDKNFRPAYDPELAKLADEGKIEAYGGEFLEGAADAVQKLI